MERAPIVSDAIIALREDMIGGDPKRKVVMSSGHRERALTELFSSHGVFNSPGVLAKVGRRPSESVLVRQSHCEPFGLAQIFNDTSMLAEGLEFRSQGEPEIDPLFDRRDGLGKMAECLEGKLEVLRRRSIGTLCRSFSTSLSLEPYGSLP
jgi:hypothetical protein